MKRKKHRYSALHLPSKNPQELHYKAKTAKRSDSSKNNQRQSAEKTLKPPPQSVLIWGFHAVREAWLNPHRKCFNLWLSEAGETAFASVLAASTLAELKRPKPEIVERKNLDNLLPPDSVHQGIVLAAAPLLEPRLHEILKSADKLELIVVLDQITDPHNVGAILRSAAAFGACAVVTTERNSPPETGVLAKSASGAVEHVPLVKVTNLARALNEIKESGFWCIGLDEEAEKDLTSIDLLRKTAIVLGAEGKGLRRLTREICDELARLPTAGAISSLNVSNAAAVALYEVKRQKLLLS